MTTNHTPGPWMKPGANYRDQTTIPVRAHECESLGIGIVFVNDDRNGETMANARLIATAPDLLAALEKLLINCEGLCKGPAPILGPHFFHHDLAKARAVIAKAKGQA
jgi:hypothetical protein